MIADDGRMRQTMQFTEQQPLRLIGVNSQIDCNCFRDLRNACSCVMIMAGRVQSHPCAILGGFSLVLCSESGASLG